MSKIIKPVHIYNKTYQWNYYVYYGVALSKYLEHFEIQAGFAEETKTDSQIAGRCCTIEHLTDGVMTFIWSKEKDLPILTHECFHAVSMTLNSRGIPFTDSTEEAYAYLLSMLIREVV